jgi:hypothetical protein
MDHDWRYTEHLKTAALALANDGFFVFPCRPIDTPDGKKAKEPLVKWKEAATIDPGQIAAWWSQHRRPDALIGLRTGMLGGVWALDIDTKNADGITELKKLEAKFGPLPETYTVKTPSGGYHYYFKLPDGIVIKNSASKIAPGIDVRGENGYVIAPPSMMADGRKYEAVDNGFTPADAAFAPSWLIVLVTSSAPRKTFEEIATRGWAHRYLARECEKVAKAEEGGRNEMLNKAAFSAGMLVGQEQLARDAAFNTLFTAAKKSGLAEEEARKTINSGLDAGSK